MPIDEYYSYAEIALICRRTASTIKTLVCRQRIPHIKAKGSRNEQRIALVPLEGVKRIRALTLGVE